MRRRRRWLAVVSLLAALALVVAACGDDDATTTAAPATTATTAAAETTTTAAMETTTTAAMETTTTAEPPPDIAFDVGVTMEPCPDAVNPENGCIYLGVISDLSDGPFAPVAIPLTQAEEDFWDAINADGGVMGFDVTITADTTVDAHYDVQTHVEGYAQIAPNSALLAQTLGTPHTQAALDGYDADNMVAVPATWYSGWAFEEVDHGLILEAGAPYCLEAMTGFDFVTGEVIGSNAFTYGIVAFPGDFGEDYAAGVKIAAAANGLPDEALVAEVLQIPISAGGDVSEAVATLAGAQPNVIFLATGPTEVGQIMGGVYGAGHQTAVYVGIGPSWNVGLLQVEALVPLLEAAYINTTPWGGWNYDSEGHAWMRSVAETNGRTPSNGYIAGFVFQFNILAVLEQAIANGDLTRDGGGLRAAAGQLDAVDYMGMLPVRSFVGDPNDFVERQIIIHKIDATQPDGLLPVTPFFAGPTASAYPFNQACSG